jgi:hypothetical protein
MALVEGVAHTKAIPWTRALPESGVTIHTLEESYFCWLYYKPKSELKKYKKKHQIFYSSFK